MTKLLSSKECEPIAREATREALVDYKTPENVKAALVLGIYDREDAIEFELYVPAKRPQDTIGIIRTVVDRRTGLATAKVLRDPSTVQVNDVKPEDTHL